jgi:hypothetical protein
MAKVSLETYIKSIDSLLIGPLSGLRPFILNMPAHMGFSFIFCAQKVKTLVDCVGEIKKNNKKSDACNCVVEIIVDLLMAYGACVLPQEYYDKAKEYSGENTPSFGTANFATLMALQTAAETMCHTLKEGKGGAMKRKKSKRKSKRSKRRAKRRSKISRRKSRK